MNLLNLGKHLLMNSKKLLIGQHSTKSIFAQFSVLDSNNQEEVQRQYQVLHNQLVASAKVVKYLHDNYPNKKIGCMQAGIFTHALTCDPNDELANQKRNA